MTIYLHCGGHKTASTFMKTFLRRNKALFESQQIAVHLDRFRDREITAEEIIKIAEQDYRNNYQQIIISEDANIIGLMPGIFQSRDRNFFNSSSILKFANLIGNISQKYKTKFLLCVRRQDTYLESCYKFRKTHGAKYSLEDFLNRVQELNISWYELVNTVASYIGKENCIVIPYELLKESQQEFIATFFKSILPIDVEKVIVPPPNNQGGSKLLMAIIDYLNSNLQEIPVKHKQEIISIVKEHQTNNTPASLFSQETCQEILQKYAISNYKLFTNYISCFPANYYQVDDLGYINVNQTISNHQLLVTNN